MKFGACYYPEHWPEERWELDVKLMKEAGLNVLRIGEFAWSKLERYEGSYDFSWMDRIIELLASHGIEVILGTPTAAPPKWLMDKHPDIYMRDNKGIARGFGNRRHYCYNNPNYMAASDRIVTAVAKHYGDRPNIIAWQTDNEFGCNDTVYCYCDYCRAAFQAWLRQTYTSIDQLNESWGTVFWSQTYNEWEQIVLPAYTVFHLHNPGLELDYRRFASDSVIAYQKRQIDLLKQFAPGQPVTHNMWSEMNEINSFELSKDLDFASWDIYPNLCFTDQPDPRESAIQLDMARGVKQAPFWVLEHQSGAPGGNIMFPTPRPGELRRWTYHSVAHGADAIVYFRWRTCLFGAEQFWHGILPHDGIPGRRYDEVKHVGEELKRLMPFIEGSSAGAEVAIIRSYENEWVMDIQPQVMGHRYIRHLKSYYRYFYDHHIPVDILSDEADFSRYRVVVLPHYMLSKPEAKQRIYDYAAQGGTVLLDFRSGSRLWDNRMSDQTLPGIYRELLGISITDYGILREGQTRSVKLSQDTRSYNAQTWYDVIRPETAEPIAWFGEDYYTGSPAATCNRYGKGAAYYLGMEPQPALMNALMDRICADAGVAPIQGIEVPDSIELTRRVSGEGREYIFAINHGTDLQSITLAEPLYELTTEQTIAAGTIELPGNGVFLFRKDHPLLG
ncbi:beta-galactosidase [Paenibacillus sp. BC26]|uniref:beta-galactosidase n=1 Tax=Paenibacillus sp. BC26 TaxID=1881032 RepID=UPI0008EF6ECE|nr:beta-galactosidase [Paenibacillus sp. BC26]SFT16300.1 beta-galactosidase [Paenibacillus sp. BC26]